MASRRPYRTTTKNRFWGKFDQWPERVVSTLLSFKDYLNNKRIQKYLTYSGVIMYRTTVCYFVWVFLTVFSVQWKQDLDNTVVTRTYRL